MIEGRIRVGVIGCGDFARLVHLPHMRADGRYRLVAACDLIAERAADVARQFDAERVCTDAARVCEAEDVDLVLVTTRHVNHAELSILAAQAGKAILCEKPLGITPESCRAVYDAVVAAGVPYTIGLDRNQSPLMPRIQRLLADLDRPCLLVARMQTNYVDERHWLLDETEGGGKILGEGCHLLDLLCQLAGADPVRVSGEGGIFTQTMPLTTPDSGVVTIRFANDSIGCMITSSVGNRAMPKERLDVYCGDTAIVADRFQTLRVFTPEGESLFSEPEGYDRKAELVRRLGDALLDGAPVPNDIHQAYRVAVTALAAVRALRIGCPQEITSDDLRPNRAAEEASVTVRDT